MKKVLLITCLVLAGCTSPPEMQDDVQDKDEYTTILAEKKKEKMKRIVRQLK